MQLSVDMYRKCQNLCTGFGLKSEKSHVGLEMAFKPLGWGRVQAWSADGTNAKNRVRQLK